MLCGLWQLIGSASCGAINLFKVGTKWFRTGKKEGFTFLPQLKDMKAISSIILPIQLGASASHSWDKNDFGPNYTVLSVHCLGHITFQPATRDWVGSVHGGSILTEPNPYQHLAPDSNHLKSCHFNWMPKANPGFHCVVLASLAHDQHNQMWLGITRGCNRLLYPFTIISRLFKTGVSDSHEVRVLQPVTIITGVGCRHPNRKSGNNLLGWRKRGGHTLITTDNLSHWFLKFGWEEMERKRISVHTTICNSALDITSGENWKRFHWTF